MDSDFLYNRKTWAQRLPEKAVDVVNGWNTYVFITLLLWLFFLRFTLHAQEEYALASAMRFYHSGPDVLSFGPWSRYVIFDAIVGFFLRFLPLGVVAFGGKMLLGMAFAYPLAHLYKLLGLSNVDVLLHLPVLYLSHQSFLGQEWMLVSLESKGIAYVFVLIALVHALQENYFTAVLFTAVASYFDLPAGGWFAAYCCLHNLANKKSLRQNIPLVVTYLGALIPLFLFLLLTGNAGLEASGTELSGVAYFQQRANLGKVTASSVFLVICVLVYRRIDEEWNRRMNLFNVLMFTGYFLFLTAVFFDRTGAFVTWFPFRASAVFAFLVFLQMVYVIRHFFVRRGVVKEIQFAVLVWFFLVIFLSAAYGITTDVNQYFF